jgi:hypothetical protein
MACMLLKCIDSYGIVLPYEIPDFPIENGRGQRQFEQLS